MNSEKKSRASSINFPDAFAGSCAIWKSSSRRSPTQNCFSPWGSILATKRSTGSTKASRFPIDLPFYPPILPDKITIFAEPLLRDFPDPDGLREQIRTTVLHEIAHYFGMDDDEIDKLGY